MINQNQFEVSLHKTFKILDSFQVPGKVNKLGTHFGKPMSVSSSYKDLCRSGSHLEIYNETLNNGYYYFKLWDGSLLQFDYSEDNIRYCILEYPLQGFILYEDFLSIHEIDYEDVGDMFFDDYEQYISNNPEDFERMILRYDYSPKQDQGYLHPISHFHFGTNNSIRIPLYGCITPCMFTLFVLKQLQLNHLKPLFLCKDFLDIYTNEKNKCIFSNKKDISNISLNELYLN